MAVVTIDAKGELAELQAEAVRDIQGEPAPADKPAGEPAKPADAPVKEPPADDPDDVEGEDGLTPRQKRDFTQAMQRTIGKKHRERREAEGFAAAQYAERKLAEQRADAAERELAKLKESAPVPRETQVDPEAGKPTRDKFDSDQAYWDAYVDWRAERKADAKIKEERAAQAKADADRRTAEILEAAKGRIGRALELVPDFREVTESIDAEVPLVVASYMQKSEMFAELGYHLAKHPDVLAKLAKLPPDEQLVTIGKIESTLKPFEAKTSTDSNGATPSGKTAVNGKEAAEASEPSQTGSTPSRARSSAPVITPLNGASGAAVTKDEADMNIREVIADYQRRNRANLGLRKRH